VVVITDVWARGSVDVLYYTQIVNNGDPKSEGGVNEASMTHWVTATLRLQEMQVGITDFRREIRSALYPGTRSGAEASSPTGDAGCLGIAELRSSMNFHRW